MRACRDIDLWFTTKVMVPVNRAVWGSQTHCQDVSRWVKETVFDKIEQWIRSERKFCRDLPWPLDFICNVVVSIQHLVTYVPRTIWNLVTDTICNVIWKIIGYVLDFIVQVIGWLATTTICVVTDPGQLLGKALDGWRILVDALTYALDVGMGVLDVGRGVVDDFCRMLDEVGKPLGWANLLLAPWRAAAKLAHLLLYAGEAAVEGAKELVKGVLLLNGCATLRGLANIGSAVVEAGMAVGFGVLAPMKAVGMTIAAIRDGIEQGELWKIVRSSIEAAFADDPPRITRALNKVGIDTANDGLSFTVAPYRMYVSTTNRIPDLRELHHRGVLDLYALAGYPSTCPRLVGQPLGEVVYAGSSVRVSVNHIAAFLAGESDDVPEFWAVAIRKDVFVRHLRVAQRKLRSIGIRLAWRQIVEYRATSNDHVPLKGADGSDPTGPGQRTQQRIFKDLGRNGRTDDLSIIPALAHFFYTDPPASEPPQWGQLSTSTNKLHGLASWYRPTPENADEYVSYSGVTYRSESPELVFRWVLAHEIGHYLGADHDRPDGNPRQLDEIMFSPSDGKVLAGGALFEFLLGGSEPRFMLTDVRTVWRWITEAGRRMLP